MPSTIGMKDGGFYDLHSSPQLSSIRILFDWIAEAVQSLLLPAAPQPITVLDLGSSEGRNALAVMNHVAERLRERTAQPIATVYSDLHSNNFNQLFRNLHAAQQSGSPPGEVYPLAAPGSFYGPLLPARTVHLATCFNAILWLDKLPPVPIPDFPIYRRPQPARPGPCGSAEAVTAFSRQAEQDWIRFLQCRARELVPGGKLIVATPGDTATHRCSDGLYDVFNDACLDLVAAGRVERQRYERLTVPIYCRTVEELLAPLDQSDALLRETFSADRAETREVPMAFAEELLQRKDVTAYANAFTGFLRAFTEPIARAALLAPGEDAAVLDALYDRVRERVRKEPDRYAFRYLVAAIMLTRR